MPYRNRVARGEFCAITKPRGPHVSPMTNPYKLVAAWMCPLYLVCLALCLQQCHPKDPQPTGSVADKKISQFEKAGYSDFLIDKAGTYHVVFQESPDNGKPVFIYYSTSTDKGSSWSKPVNISNDNTGNGSGYARILQDGSGTLYAIWKRYGNAQLLQREANLDGPGGHDLGTITYSVLNGGTWSQPVRISETEATQDTWFATLTPQGKVAVFWAQLGPAAQQENYSTYYWYCDFIRDAVLSGTSKPTITNLTTPAVKPSQYAQIPKQGVENLGGYIDASGTIHLTFENTSTNGVDQVIYFNGKTSQVAYSYPKYAKGNSFRNPAQLLVDEKGVDHLIYLPPSSTLESEQVWDINLATGQKTIIFNFSVPGSRISGFQATQGPNGQMGVVVEANPKRLDNIEAYGCFYQNGVWQFGGLTSNAAKDDFKSTEVNTYYGPAYFSSITSYHSSFGSVAWDGAGRKSMTMTLAAQWIGTGGYSTSSPSIVYVPIDQ
jgi:hypothetical protein